MSVVGALQLVLLAALAFAAIAGAMASLAVRPVLGITSGWLPESRHRALILLAFCPVIFPFAGVLATLAPSLLGLVWPGYDHCLVHPGTHAHLCVVHLPTHLGNPGSWLLLLAVTCILAVRAKNGVAELRRASRLSSQLLSHGFPEPRLSASVIPTSRPWCLSVGVLRPTTVVSAGLLSSVSSEQLRAVLLHEQAHANRHDTLFRLLARAATVLVWPSARMRLLQEIELAAEQSCDEAAARGIGDRLTMAEVILKVERLLAATPGGLGPFAVSLGGTAVPLRVAALLAPPRSERATAAPGALLFFVLAALFAASEPLHHLTETLLGAFTH